MQTVLQQSYAPSYTRATHKQSVFTRFITWCKNQQENRFLWMAVALTGHACLITPLTVAIIMLTGNSMVSWSFAIAAIGMVLVTNLAALPTRVTIPTFLFSILLDLGIIAGSLSIWL